MSRIVWRGTSRSEQFCEEDGLTYIWSRVYTIRKFDSHVLVKIQQGGVIIGGREKKVIPSTEFLHAVKSISEAKSYVLNNLFVR